MRGFAVLVSSILLAACSSSSGDAADADDDAAGDAGGDATTNDSIVSFDADAKGDAATDLPDGLNAGTLNCTWAADTKNCWRVFVRGVDTCLGNVAGLAEQGTMSTDGTTCDYVTGRSVAFTLPFDSVESDVDRDFSVAKGGATCLHFVQHAGSTGFVVTGPAGTLTYSAISNDVTITCPDGKSYEGDAKKLAIGCGEEIFLGHVPGDDIESSPDRFKLMGSADWDFACEAPGADAGVDGDAPDDAASDADTGD